MEQDYLKKHYDLVFEGPDDLESSDLETRANGLAIALSGWWAKNQSPLPQEEYAENEKLYSASILYGARVLFDDLKKLNQVCDYHIGAPDIMGHELRAFGDSYALFGGGLLRSEAVYPLDYLGWHSVPQDCPYDLPSGFASRLQPYFGSIRGGVAISVNQLARSFLYGGRLYPRYRGPD